MTVLIPEPTCIIARGLMHKPTRIPQRKALLGVEPKGQRKESL